MNEHHRRPAAFRLDDPNVVVTAEQGRPARGTVRVMVEPESSLPIMADIASHVRGHWEAVRVGPALSDILL